MTRKEHIERAIFLFFLIISLLPILSYFRVMFVIPLFVLSVLIIAHVAVWTEDYYKGKRTK